MWTTNSNFLKLWAVQIKYVHLIQLSGRLQDKRVHIFSSFKSLLRISGGEGISSAELINWTLLFIII